MTDWIALKKTPIASQLSDKDLNYECTKIVTQSIAMITNGNYADAGVITFLKEHLFKELRWNKTYSNLTIGEVLQFFLNGVNLVYPQFKGYLNTVNVQNINHWLKCGLSDETRLKSLRAHEESQFVEKVPTKEDIDRLMEQGLKTCIEFINNPTTYQKPPFAAIYDYLNEKYGVEVERRGQLTKTLIPDINEAVELTKKAKAEHLKSVQKLHRNKVTESTIHLFTNGKSIEWYWKEQYCRRFLERMVMDGEIIK